jgi:hypothetical protein
MPKGGWGGECDGYYNYNIYRLQYSLGSEPEYADIDDSKDSVYNSEFKIIKYNL